MRSDVKEALFQRPFLVTVVFTICSFWASLTVNGLYNVALENIIRRYGLSATFMSSVPATYGAVQCLLVIPLTYRFGRKCKAKVIGGSLIMFSIGVFIFSLPHLLSDEYLPMEEQESCDAECSAKLSSVKYLFNVAYFLIGMGNIPMVTLTLSYICENNFYGTIETNYHYALYHAGTAFGPAVGMLVAGQFTNVWVDWYDKGLSPPGELSTDSKLWVGTWWLPYWIVSGVLFIIGSFIVCFVPETLVSSYQAHQLDETLSNRTESTCVSASQSFHSTAGSFRSQTPSISRKTFRDSQRNIYVSGEGHDWSDLIPSYKKLFTNFAFLGLTGSCTADMGFVSIIGIYGIQFLAEVYNFSISGASIIFSASLSTVMIALPLSGYMIRGQTNNSKQSIKRTLKYMRIFNCIAFISLLSFFMECDDTRYYYLGGDLNYDQFGVNTTWIPSVDEHPYNSNQMYGHCSADLDRECPCGTNEYIPACATMSNGTKVTFFNPCHLGCNIIQLNQSARATNSDNNLNTDEYQLENCRCTENASVELGSCAKYNCDWRIYFIIPCLVIACFSTFLQVVPGTMVGQAVVPDHLRTAALGLQALLFRAFGSIPLPVIAAKIIDSKCYWWGTSCMNERGACRAFDKYGMRTSFVTIIIILKLLSILCYSISIKFTSSVDHLKNEPHEKD